MAATPTPILGFGDPVATPLRSEDYTEREVLYRIPLKNVGDEARVVVRLADSKPEIPLKAQRPALHRQGDDQGTEGPDLPIKHGDTVYCDLISVADHEPRTSTASGTISVYPHQPTNKYLIDNHVRAYYLWVGTDKRNPRERIWRDWKRSRTRVTISAHAGSETVEAMYEISPDGQDDLTVRRLY